MKLNTQNDPRWGKEPMAHPEDTLAHSGCLVTSLANILSITPLAMSGFLKAHQGYLGLLEPVPPEYRSCLVWEPVLKYFCLNRSVLLPGEIEEFNSSSGFFLIGKYLLYPTVTHFVNILSIKGRNIEYFDVATGKRQVRPENEWVTLVKLTKKKQ